MTIFDPVDDHAFQNVDYVGRDIVQFVDHGAIVAGGVRIGDKGKELVR